MSSMLADVITVRHRHGGARRRVSSCRPRARPAPPTTTPTPGSSATRRTWSTGVWFGLDKPAPIMNRGFAAVVAVPAWADFMKTATADDRPDWFQPPADVEKVAICRVSGLLATDACRHGWTGVDYVQAGLTEMPGEAVGTSGRVAAAPKSGLHGLRGLLPDRLRADRAVSDSRRAQDIPGASGALDRTMAAASPASSPLVPPGGRDDTSQTHRRAGRPRHVGLGGSLDRLATGYPGCCSAAWRASARIRRRRDRSRGGTRPAGRKSAPGWHAGTSRSAARRPLRADSDARAALSARAARRGRRHTGAPPDPRAASSAAITA